MPGFYVVSEQEAHDTSGLWIIEPKPYLRQEPDKPPIFAIGDMLQFSMLINPTFDNSDRTKKQKTRYDLMIHLRHQMTKNEYRQREEHHAVNEHRACKEWLERRQNLGFEVMEPDETLIVE